MQNERFADRQGLSNDCILLTLLVFRKVTGSGFDGVTYILPHFAVWVKTIFQVRCNRQEMREMVFQSTGFLW